MFRSHILGSTRIGRNRELKFVLEKFWRTSTKENERQLHQTKEKVCSQNWKDQKQSGLDFITVGDFAFYDHVLTTLVLVSSLPKRFGILDQHTIKEYFAAARGDEANRAMEMRKWFNTNYHYMVPEFEPGTTFHANTKWLLDEIDLASLFHHQTKVVILGPISLLWIGKECGGLTNKLELLPNLLEAYKNILIDLKKRGIDLVQIDEPAACLTLSDVWVEALKASYNYLSKYFEGILLTTFFSFPTELVTLLLTLPILGVHIDVTSSFELHKIPKQPRINILSIGVVNGRDVWKANINNSVRKISQIKSRILKPINLWVATSCSLLHTPNNLSDENGLEVGVSSGLAFGSQKIEEVCAIKMALKFGWIRSQSKIQRIETFNPRVGFAVEELLTNQDLKVKRNNPQLKQLGLPLIPTTTVGSFPQTQQIRELRSNIRKGLISCGNYVSQIKAEISFIIAKQISLGLDVLVHGEVERNDMVEYFGEQLNGFIITKKGWVQSYGSRCVKPPIVFGDISFVSPMSVFWFKQAQKLTTKPVKGMLTGPTTMLNWSFVRRDLSIQEISVQVCNALKIELGLLKSAGAKVIQIDEPAIREGLPLNQNGWGAYLNWVVRIFNILAAYLPSEIQVHTHMCYFEFNELMDAILNLDVDAISVEAARSNMASVNPFKEHCYSRGIGFGMYDIHSPIIPNEADILNRIRFVLSSFPKELVWANPDCGLKTRTWNQVEASLKNLVQAALVVRKGLIKLS
ncbi:cobalamin-independent homocysteine transmethylase [Candidatus Tremblaya phenacola PAVE]|nr:cobalamin-independent homocysteine transmethylase [Candidatus Tremblaya phenacola PAVE]